MYIKANSKKICEAEYLFLFSRKMLMSAFLLSFKVNNLEEMRGHPNFSLWIPIARAKIYFFRMVSIMVSIPLYSVSTDLKASLEIWRYVISFMLGSGAIRVWGMCQPRTTTMKLLVSRFFPGIQPKLFILQWLAHALCLQMIKILRSVRAVVISMSAHF